MRRALLAAALAASTLSSGPTAAQDEKRAETIDGLARIVGAQAGIVLYCRKLYTVDDAVSESLSRTVRRALEAAVGRRQAEAAIAEEGQRVARTIGDVGADQWCADQRDILNTDGVRVFVD